MGRSSSMGVWVCAVALVCVPVGSDLIFHVPEVLVRHAAVPRPVGTGRGNASRASNDSEPWTSEEGLVHQRYEYYVEHQVSAADAKKAAAQLDVTPGAPLTFGCGACSRREMEYCETKVMADHCCCERRYVREPFPWFPHTCYVGPERCRPLADNCAHYARLRDCCCTEKLAQHWKALLSSGRRVASALPLVAAAALGALARH